MVEFIDPITHNGKSLYTDLATSTIDYWLTKSVSNRLILLVKRRTLTMLSLLTPVAITAFRFNSKTEAIPCRIELDGVNYHLNDSYKIIETTLNSGHGTIFDVSDGTHRFRLLRHMLEWKLVGIYSENV